MERETESVLGELYAEVGKYELKGRELYDEYINLIRQNFSHIDVYKPLDELLSELEELEKSNNNLHQVGSELRELKAKGVEVVLGVSDHELYGQANKVHSTGFSKRKASMEFKKNPFLIGDKEGEQRSFLRVWVIALPK